MATFKEQLSIDLESSFFDNDFFATSATFTPSSGSPVSCDVIVDHEALVQLDGYEIGVTTLGTTIDAMVSVVGTPKSGDTFLVDGTTYTVKSVESNDNSVVKLLVR